MFVTVGCYTAVVVTIGGAWLLLPCQLSDFCIKVIGLGTVLYLTLVAASRINRILSRKRITSANKAVFITGCDSGFGHLLAKRLDNLGFTVFAGCLFPSADGAANLRATSSNRLNVIDLDVTKDDSVQNALNIIKNSLGVLKLWAVVNNAGVIKRGELEWISLDDIKVQLEVNTLGMVRVTQAFLPLLRESKGRMVATTSFGGRYSFPYFAGYCMSKHAAVAFCDALRMELYKWSIKVVTVQPFAYRSPMTNTNNVVKDVEEAWTKVPKELQNTYGPEYFNLFKESTVKFNDFASAPNTYEVVDCLEEAVTAVSPHYNYTPSNLKSSVGFWFIKRLPPFWGNFIVKRCVMMDAHVDRYVRNNRSTENTKKNC